MDYVKETQSLKHIQSYNSSALSPTLIHVQMLIEHTKRWGFLTQLTNTTNYILLTHQVHKCRP